MNRASIPGFYFDEEKKKYFKIQANHRVPQDAKYSRGNVKQQDRKAKKQKTEHLKQIKRQKHTVKRSLILQNPLIGGTGLSREYGVSTKSSYADQQDAAIISQFRLTTVTVRPRAPQIHPRIRTLSAIYIPETGQMVTASTDNCAIAGVLYVHDWHWDNPEFQMPQGCGLAVFYSQITSMSLASGIDSPRLVASSRQDASSGQVYTSAIPRPGAAYNPPGIYYQLKNCGDNRLVTSINPETSFAAVSTAKSVFILDDGGNISNSISHDDNEYHIAIDWLDNNTVAFESNSPDSNDHHIKLWDVRTPEGIVSRFKVRSRITGILNPSRASHASRTDGRQLLASTNHRINLYDTRMHHNRNQEDTPLLSFPHTHGGPELEFTTNGQNLIAAVDRDNVVEIFSMRSGRRMDSLSIPEPKSAASENSTWHPIVKNLQWYDDPKVGSALQACVGSGIVRWSWGGDVDEDG